jgi:hypothetical protein
MKSVANQYSNGDQRARSRATVGLSLTARSPCAVRFLDRAMACPFRTQGSARRGDLHSCGRASGRGSPIHGGRARVLARPHDHVLARRRFKWLLGSQSIAPFACRPRSAPPVAPGTRPVDGRRAGRLRTPPRARPGARRRPAGSALSASRRGQESPAEFAALTAFLNREHQRRDLRLLAAAPTHKPSTISSPSAAPFIAPSGRRSIFRRSEGASRMILPSSIEPPRRRDGSTSGDSSNGPSNAWLAARAFSTVQPRSAGPIRVARRDRE